MEGLSAVRLRDQERGQEESIFDDDRSLRHDPDSSSVHLLVPPRPQSQRFHSHEIQVDDSQRGHTTRLWQTFWFLLTIVLIIFIFGTVKIYQSRGNFAPVQKHVFNTISTALILALGLNFFEAFKSLAKGSRSRILKLENYNAREKDLISNIDNLTDVIILGWKSCKKPHTRPWTALLCITWILINILAQTAVATISLTYSVVDGTNWKDTYERSGVANAPNLTFFAFGPAPNGYGGDVTNQARAHAGGDIALGFPCGAYNDTSQILNSQEDYRYYCRRNRHQQEFAYRFNEYNPADNLKAYPRFTKRIITASAGECFEYQMVGEPSTVSDGNVDYKYTNGTLSGNITIPAQSGAFDGTTYIYQGINTPQKAVTYACGPRCIWVWAHKSRGHGEKSVFVQCPITVNTVTNAPNDTQHVSDDMARIAAASIALQGRPAGTNIWKQYQLYTFGLHWETHFKEPDEVGANMAEFAIGSISTMAYRNPQIPVNSLVPYLGSHIEVKWYYLIPLLAGISGAHLALFLLNIYAT